MEVPGLPTHDARCHHSRLVETGCAQKLCTVYKPFHCERKGQWGLSNFCSHETSKKFLVIFLIELSRYHFDTTLISMHDALKVSVQGLVRPEDGQPKVKAILPRSLLLI